MRTHSIDNIEFTYTLSERKTASLFVERDGHIHLISPEHLSIEQIEQLITRRLEKLNK